LIVQKGKGQLSYDCWAVAPADQLASTGEALTGANDQYPNDIDRADKAVFPPWEVSE